MTSNEKRVDQTVEEGATTDSLRNINDYIEQLSRASSNLQNSLSEIIQFAKDTERNLRDTTANLQVLQEHEKDLHSTVKKFDELMSYLYESVYLSEHLGTLRSLERQHEILYRINNFINYYYSLNSVGGQAVKSTERGSMPNKENMAKFSSNLSLSLTHTKKALTELQRVTRERTKLAQTLSREVKSLSIQQHDLGKQIIELRKISIPAVEHFIKIADQGEKRSAFRDYGLFIAGVIVSVIIAVILKVFFGI